MRSFFLSVYLYLHVFSDVSKSYFVHDNSVLTFIARKFCRIPFCLPSATSQFYKFAKKYIV